MNLLLISPFQISLIVKIFLFLIVARTTQAAKNENYTLCGEGYKCGSKTYKYPFYGSDRPICGVPGFEITCENDIYSSFKSGSQSFNILSMDESNHTMTIAQADLWSYPCPKNLDENTLNTTLFNYSPSTENITLYSSCPVDILGKIEPKYKISCGNINYVLDNPFVTDHQCQNPIKIPVLRNNSDVFPEDGDLTLLDLLEKGFEVNYTLDETKLQLCNDCEGSGGICGTNTSSTADDFICFCKDGSYAQSCPERKSNERRRYIVIAIQSILGAAILLILLAVMIKFSKNYRSKSNNERKVEDFLKNHGSLSPKRYTHSQLKKITNSFKTKLGQGGFGSVFKGQLNNGRDVAVKLLKEVKGSGEDFINEVAAISRTSHVNIVCLVGYCSEGHKRALVFEFMPNGSLEKFICDKDSKKNKLGWDVLYKIVIGIARGLEYLHSGCNTRILHLDIKPHNILLDEDFWPKISDFGLAKLCPRKESIISLLEARGTIGYIAPEVFNRNFGRVSHKSDVYSYGMMVLEMVGGREKPDIEAEVGHTSDIYFPNWIYKHLERNEDLGLHGDTIEDANENLRKMIIVGLWCIQTDPTHRPSMSKVMEMLEGSLEEMEIPPKPYLASLSRSIVHSSTTSCHIKKLFDYAKSDEYPLQYEVQVTSN